MNSQDNPYLNLLQIMEGQSPKQGNIIHYGNIVSIEPLQLKVSGLIIDKHEILVSANIDFSKIAVHDNVVLLSEDEQTFILLCKVVQ